ncbi:MAG: CehA/McbA family metallohydrolase, partial [Deltaproteobacteria bacterium]|nr:CehA/McbA family metallohydrolase [Deltaproteobacteria bacterium]
GRVVTSKRATATQDIDIGDIQIPHSATLELTVLIDDEPGEALVLIQPVGEYTRNNVRGKLNGRFKECAPLLGAPYGPSPACNRVLLNRGGPVTLEVPPGNYHVYATAGPFATLDRKTVTLEGGGQARILFELQKLEIKPAGSLSADLHVHCGKSYDSPFPERDRIVSVLAADLDVIAVTDHDLTHDYQKTINELEVSDRFALMSGTESTGYILFLNVPGSMIPKVIGHWNFWPIFYKPEKPRGGVPWTQLAEPGELFERMEQVFSGTPVIQLNHPWEKDFAGRDQGWPRVLAFDLNRRLPSQADGSSMGLFVRVPACGPEQALGCTKVKTRNDAYHVQEVINGTDNTEFLQDRAFWFYLLNQGIVHAGTANSDSHFLVDDMIGSPRNIVFTSTTVANFSPDTFNQAVREGRMFGTNGPMVEIATTDASGNRQTPSTLPFSAAPDANLEIKVSAAAWVPVEEIRIYINGELTRTIIDGISHPQDPFGTQGILRYQGSVPLTELLPSGNKDAYIVVEAGTKLPIFGDLNHNGVPDTTDNNGDGRVDLEDVEESQRKECKPGADPGSCGPLNNPEKPKDESDPRFHFNMVVPESYPLAFTNPLLLDRDADGIFSGPGLPGGGE